MPRIDCLKAWRHWQLHFNAVATFPLAPYSRESSWLCWHPLSIYQDRGLFGPSGDPQIHGELDILWSFYLQCYLRIIRIPPFCLSSISAPSRVHRTVEGMYKFTYTPSP